MNSISNIFSNFFYNFLVKGPAFLLLGASKAISWLSSFNLISLIFGSKAHKITPPHIYISFAILGGAIFLIILCIQILKSFEYNNTKSTILTLCKNFILYLFFLITIPIIFWCINFITNQLLFLIFHVNNLSGKTFANEVLNIGWLSGGHQNFDFMRDGYPDWAQYSIFVGSIAVISSLVMFFFLSFTLVKRVFTLFVYYVQAPLVISKALSGNEIGLITKWKNDILTNFMITFTIFLSFNSFTLLVPKIMIILANNHTLDNATKIFLKISIIVGGSFTTYYLAHEIQHFVQTTYGFTNVKSLAWTVKNKTKRGINTTNNATHKLLSKTSNKVNNKAKNNVAKIGVNNKKNIISKLIRNKSK